MLNIQENVTVEICVASEGKYIVGHLIDSGFVGRRKDAIPWTEWGAKSDEKKPSALGRRRIAGSGHDAAVIILNYCSQLGKAVTLAYSNRNTVFLYCSLNKEIQKPNKPNPIEYHLAFLNSFFPDHAAEVYCGKMTVLYLSWIQTVIQYLRQMLKFPNANNIFTQTNITLVTTIVLRKLWML